MKFLSRMVGVAFALFTATSYSNTPSQKDGTIVELENFPMVTQEFKASCGDEEKLVRKILDMGFTMTVLLSMNAPRPNFRAPMFVRPDGLWMLVMIDSSTENHLACIVAAGSSMAFPVHPKGPPKTVPNAEPKGGSVSI